MNNHEWANYKIQFMKELEYQSRCLLKYMDSQYGINKLTDLAKQEISYSVDRVKRVLYSMPDYKTAD